MKKVNSKIFVLLLVAAMTTAACSSVNDVEDSPSNVQLVKVSATVDDIQSRATNITTSNLTNYGFGLYICAGIGTRISYSDVKYESDAWKLTNALPWPVNSNSVYVFAYSPIQPTSPVTAGSSYNDDTVMALSSNTTDGNEPIDWLYDIIEDVPATVLAADGTLPIAFKHAMSRLRITVNFNAQVSTSEYSIGKVWIEGLNYNGRLNMYQKRVDIFNQYANIYASNTNESNNNIYSAFIVPQYVSANRLKVHIQLNKSGSPYNTYTYTYPTAITFGIGTAYSLKLTVGSYPSLTATGIGITSWSTGSTDIDVISKP